MSKQIPLIAFLISALAGGLSLPAAQADTLSAPVVRVSAGAIVGIVTNSAKAPVAGATVTAMKSDGSGIRATISGSDGMYSFADVPAGTWAIASHIDGAADAAPPAVTVIVGKASRADIVMNVPEAAGAETAPVPVVALPPVAAGTTHMLPTALEAPDPGPEVDTQTPFAVGDIGWMNGNTREKSPIFDTKFFTPEIRFDTNYIQSGNHPQDHTIVGSTEEFRSGEFQIEQVSFGGDFHWNNVKARFLSMMGLFSTATTPRMMPAPQWASGTSRERTSISRKRMRAITSTSTTA